MSVVWLVIGLIVGFVAGLFIGMRFGRGDVLGTLKYAYDETDGESYLFLEISNEENATRIKKSKYVRFKVDPSHK